jgi:hypothetical protein
LALFRYKQEKTMDIAAETPAKTSAPARMSLSLATRQNALLEEMAETTGMSKNELLRHAVALLSIVVKAREKGLALALAEEDDDRVKERIVSTV